MPSRGASPSGVDARELLRLELLSDFGKYTRAMFREQNHTDYIVAPHHRAIMDALQRVVDGYCRRLIINIAPRYGKAVAVDTPMLTSRGWRRADEVSVGDTLYGMDGRPTSVVGVYPQGVTRRWRVRFSDGTSLLTCGEHRWLARTRYDVRSGSDGWRVVTTDGLRETLREGDHWRWRIPTASPVELGDADLPLDPYLFGCWLGDGDTHKAGLTTMDPYIVSRFEEAGYVMRPFTHQNSGRAVSYGISGGFVTALRSLGVLGMKRIPDVYMMSSPRQRRELLAGLLDTDGTCNRKNGQVSYCSTEAGLLADVRTLAESLGYFVTEYRSQLFIRAWENPFRLGRKATLYSPPTSHHHTERLVVGVDAEPDGETVCFEVDNASHTYLAGRDLIVTHNTELAIKSFISWGFALNPKCRFLHLSYSDMLVNDNSDTIRSIMSEPLYKELFPQSALVSEKGASKRWKTKAGGELYAVSTQGQVTGFGAGRVDSESKDFLTGDAELDEALSLIGAGRVFDGAIVIDDPIKPEDAESDVVRERVNARFENTIRNRTNSRNTPIIIIMQRLHEHDLCGYLMEAEPGEWEVLSLPAIRTDPVTGEQSALWPLKHDLEELRKLREINPCVFDTQYMQDPTPREGLMYGEGFRTYSRSELPHGAKVRRINYTDTADTGSDFLCSVCAIDTEEYVYVTDVYFTDEPMEVTERENARMLVRNGTRVARIESNNGGRAYARNVKRILRSEFGSYSCAVQWFTQTENKQSRIFSHSANVMCDVLMPEGWERMWPKFYGALMSYRKDNRRRNKHDDAPDCVTGLWEMHSGKGQRRGIRRRN